MDIQLTWHMTENKLYRLEWICARIRTHLCCCVNQRKQFTETVQYRDSKRILDIVDVLGVKRGPISGNRGPIQILSSTVRVPLLPLHVSLLVGSLKRKASTGARTHGNRCP